MCFGYCKLTIFRLCTGQVEGNYFLFKCCIHPDDVYCEVDETCSCNLQLLHYSFAIAYYILLLHYNSADECLFSRCCSTKRHITFHEAVRWRSTLRVSDSWVTSVRIQNRGWIHPLTEEIPKEFWWGWTAFGMGSWEIRQPISVKFQTKAVFPTSHLFSETPLPSPLSWSTQWTLKFQNDSRCGVKSFKI